MFYEYELEVAANTLEFNPATLEIQLVKGTIDHVEVFFPPGCNRLVDVAIWHSLRQVWPTPPAESFADDNFHLIFSEAHPLSEPPYNLTLLGWSSDTRYSHTIAFRFGISPIVVPAAPLTLEQLIGTPVSFS